MKKQIYHSLVLDDTQVRYLMSGTAGINRLACLFQLIELLMAQIERTADVGECPKVLWQVKMSEVALAKLWKCDRKTVSKMLDKMEELAILSSVQTRRGSVHTFLCISAWGIDGRKFVNPNYVPIHLRNGYARGEEAKSAGDEVALPLPSSKSDNTDSKPTDIAEIHNSTSNDAITGVDKQAETAALSSSLCSSPDNTKAIEQEIPDPDQEALQMEEEARQHFIETEMERGELSTDGNPSGQSHNGDTHAGSSTSNEDDAQR